MKKNRCFKLTALLLAMIMMISVFPSFALGATQSEGKHVPGIETTELDSTFVESAKILDASNKEVKDLSAADPNGSFTLKLKVKESLYAESDEEKLPSDTTNDTTKVLMCYSMENMTAESGENSIVSWEYDADENKLYFDWKEGKQTSFEASIKIYPNYPATNDLSGSYVLGTAGNVPAEYTYRVMLTPNSFMDGKRERLEGVAFEEVDGKVYILSEDVASVWELKHVTGNYYTVRSKDNGKYLKINTKTNGLLLEEATDFTAQKLLVEKVKEGYYAFKYADKSINNSGYNAVRGFASYNSTDTGGNAILKLYNTSDVMTEPIRDMSGTWAITNAKTKNAITAENHSTNGRLTAIPYTADGDQTDATEGITTFTFEHIIRDWYTVKTDSGYLNISDTGAFISNNPQHLAVLSDNQYSSIVLTNSEQRDKDFKNVGYFLINVNGKTSDGYGTARYFEKANKYFNDKSRLTLVSVANTINENPQEVIPQAEAVLAFDVNGGTGAENPATVEGNVDEKIVLPDLNATKNGQEFIGWADVKDFYAKVSGTNHSYHELYKAGSTYTLKNGTNTLYAVYNPTTRKVQFGIRKDGVIQDEPNNYPVDSYCGHFTVEGILKEGHWVVDIDSTKTVNGYYVQNDVIAALNWVPSAEQIAAALKKEGNIDFDPETQYIHYYVLKDTSKDVWKVDGVIRNKKKVSVTYNANVPGAEKTLIKSMPGGAQVVVGSEILIGTNAGSTEVLKPTRDGYLFNGWNTEPDGSGTSYSEGHYVKLTANLNLYAQWVRSNEGQMIIRIESTWPAGKPAYEGTEITLTAKLTGFEGKEYTLQWQYSTDLDNWIDEPGANNITYTYTMNETTATYTWRVVAKDIH